MQNTFDYARDERSPEDYRDNVIRGIKNQLPAIQAFGRMLKQAGFEVRIVANKPDEEFSEDGPGIFEVDYEVFINGVQHHIEVKATRVECIPFEIKEKQINKMLKLKRPAFVLTCVPSGFWIVAPKFAAKQPTGPGKSQGGHPCYLLPKAAFTDKAKVNWTTPPIFV